MQAERGSANASKHPTADPRGSGSSAHTRPTKSTAKENAQVYGEQGSKVDKPPTMTAPKVNRTGLHSSKIDVKWWAGMVTRTLSTRA